MTDKKQPQYSTVQFLGEREVNENFSYVDTFNGHGIVTIGCLTEKGWRQKVENQKEAKHGDPNARDAGAPGSRNF